MKIVMNKTNFLSQLLRSPADEGTSGATTAEAAETPVLSDDSVTPTEPTETSAADKPKAGSLISGDEDDNSSESFEPIAADAITLPEGVERDEEAITGFLEIMNNQELSRADLAQKLVDYQVSAQQKGMEASVEAATSLWDQTQDEWRTAAEALPEIGGEALPATLAQIKKGLIAAGADESTFDAMNLTGAGNHPAIIKVLHKLTASVTETPPVKGDPTTGKLSQAERMFGAKE